MVRESNEHNYTISLYNDYSEPEIDIDELEGIIQQLDAISRGWADDFKVVIKYETEPFKVYKWENNNEQ
jgi:hypothetical protein